MIALHLCLIFALLLAQITPALAAAPPAGPRPAQTGVSGSVWQDDDGDGRFDGNEVGLPYLHLCLRPAPDADPAACAYTELDGSYVITGVTPGGYILAVSADSVLPVYDPTTPATLGPLTLDDAVIPGQNVGYRFRLPSDANRDCRIDVVDIAAVAAALGDAPSPLDFDGDGAVDADDVGLAAADWAGYEACTFADADGDWLPDAYERQIGSDPASPDGDGDGLDDYREARFTATAPRDPDSDDDGLDDFDEVVTFAADPWRADTDGDGAGDGLEAHTMHTDPAAADTDGDGLGDAAEDADRDGVLDPGETDPATPDTDGDGLWDGFDVTPGPAALAGDVIPMAGRIPGELDHGADPRNPDTDGDGLEDGEEVRSGTAPTDGDSDDDGLGDAEEMAAGADGFITDPLDPDGDDDGLPDGDEAQHGCNPNLPDTDGDKLQDDREIALSTACTNPDHDGDGLPDGDEVDRYGTDPRSADGDGDAMPDRWEVEHGLDGTVADAAADPDGDALTNLREFGAGTDPLNPDSDADLLPDGDEIDKHATDPLDPDSDDDDARDGDEIAFGTNPLDPDSDDDGAPDGAEPAWATDVDNDGLICALDRDCDGDGIADGEERIAGADGAVTDPARADTDGDGSPDAWELAQGFDPADAGDGSGDADSDTISNTLEYTLGSDPWNDDSDADTLPDGFELDQGLNPADAADAGQDKDGDGLSNAAEFAAGLPIDEEDADGDGLRDGEEPNWNGDTDGDALIDALDADADDDGLSDGEEVLVYATSPLLADSDGDTLDDAAELRTHGTNPLAADSDGDTLPDGEELAAGADGYITDPLARDSDGDGLDDDFEIRTDALLAPAAGLPNLYLTNPAAADSDGDGLNDGEELALALDPTAADSDGDGLNDGDELALGSSPHAPDTDADGVPDGPDLAPLDPDADGDGRRDGDELTPGWNGDWTQAEDATPGAVVVVPDVGTDGAATVAVHGGDSVVAGWQGTAPRAGDYRLLLRARSNGQDGDRMAVQVQAAAAFTETFALGRGLFRWHSTAAFSVAAAAPVTVTVRDLQFGAQAVLLDQLLLVRAENDLFFPATLAANPDSDGDGLSDGAESLSRSLWLEAEHHPAPISPGPSIRDDVLAANSKALENNQPNQLILRLDPAQPALSPGVYQIFARTRRLTPPAPQPDLLFHLESGGNVYDLGLQELTDWYEWQPAGGTVTIAADGHFTLDVSVQGQAGAVALDKLLFAPLEFHIRAVDAQEPAIPAPFEGMRPPPGQPWGAPVSGELRIGQPLIPTDPLDMDTDGDGERPYGGIVGVSGWLTDGFEIEQLASNPFSIDTDGDADLYLWDVQTQTWLFQPDFILDDNGGWDTNADCIPDGAPAAPDGLPDWSDAADCNPLSLDSDDDDLLDPIDPKPADADIDDDGLKDGEEDLNLNAVYDPGVETDLGLNWVPGGHPPYDCIADGLLPGWDTDGDHIADGTERGRTSAAVTVFSDPRCFVPDQNPASRTDPAAADSDGDGLPDGDEDADHDGARDPAETAAHSHDTDGDGLWDGHDRDGHPGELDPHHPAQTQATDPLDPDSDGDGLADGVEILSANQTNPNDGDTDGDGAGDGAETAATHGYATNPALADSDGDGLLDAAEMITGTAGVKTSPLLPDTDGDGLWDGYDVGAQRGELSTHTIIIDGSPRPAGPTDPRSIDSDGDGLGDAAELNAGPATNPAAADSDGDGFPDGYETDAGSDPAGSADVPDDVLAGSVILSAAGGDWAQQADGSFQVTGTVTLAAFGAGQGMLAAACASPPAPCGRGPGGSLAAARLLHPDPAQTRLEIQGTVVVLPDGVSITGSGRLVITLLPGHTVTLADAGAFRIDGERGVLTVTGGLNSNVKLGGWDFAEFERFDDSQALTIDLANGAVRGKAAVRLHMGPEIYHTLSASFLFTPTAPSLALFTTAAQEVIPLDMAGIDHYFGLGEASLLVDVAERSFRGRAKIVDWALGDSFFEGGGPELDIGWDEPGDRYWFRADLQAGTTLQAGGLTLSVSAPAGGKFGFEVGVSRPYVLIEAALDVPPLNEVLTIDEVQLEIDPSGGAVLTPQYPVGEVLTEPITGHIRFLGDVTAHIPLPAAAQGGAQEDGRETEPQVEPEEGSLTPSLDVHIAGERLFRIDRSGGCDHAFAANGTLGLGVSAAFVGLMYDFGGVSMHLGFDGPAMPQCRPNLLAIALVQNGVELGNFGTNPILNELGKINLQPQAGVAVEFDIPAGTMTLAGTYEVGPFDLETTFVVDAYGQEMRMAGTLDTAFLQGGVGLNGRLSFAGELALAGEARVGLAGFDVFDAEFALTNDRHAAHMLTAAGTLTIPSVGEAAVSGWLDGSGEFELTGAATLAPAGFTLASAQVQWTRREVSLQGTISLAPLGSVLVTGRATPAGFLLTGKGVLDLGGFGMAAAVSISDHGLQAAGEVRVWDAATLGMSGRISPDGSFLFTAQGTVVLHGYRFASASFLLEKSASSFRFSARADLKLGERTLSEVTVDFRSGGGFSAAIRFDWGFRFDAALTVAANGDFVFTTSAQDLSLSTHGYGLSGSFSVTAAGSASNHVTWAGTGSARVKLAGATVFSGRIAVSSSGRVQISYTKWGKTVSVTFKI